MSDLQEPQQGQAARIRYTAGFTANAGNFESIRLDVSIEDSARPGEKISEASARVYAMVEHELLEKFTQTRADIKEVEKGQKAKGKKGQ